MCAAVDLSTRRKSRSKTFICPHAPPLIPPLFLYHCCSCARQNVPSNNNKNNGRARTLKQSRSMSARCSFGKRSSDPRTPTSPLLSSSLRGWRSRVVRPSSFFHFYLAGGRSRSVLLHHRASKYTVIRRERPLELPPASREGRFELHATRIETWLFCSAWRMD